MPINFDSRSWKRGALSALLFTAGAVCFSPSSTSAQTTVTVTGRVVSEDQPTVGVADATLSLGNLQTRTDSTGAFTLRGVPVGRQTIVLHRVGYFEQQESIDVSVGDNAPIIIPLKAIAPVLDTVKVKAKTIPMSLEPFEDRRLHGQGSYLTRADLEKERDHQLSEVLVRVSGLNVIRLSAGDAAIASRRGGRVTYGSKGGDAMDRLRGAAPACYSQIFIDGMRVFAPEPNRPLFNINNLRPDEIEGIEFYRSAAETPAQYSNLESDCGTMLIWTRRGGPSK